MTLKWITSCNQQRVLNILNVNIGGKITVSAAQNICQIKLVLWLLHELAAAEEDVKADRTAPIQDTFDDIRGKLLEMKSESFK